MRHYSHPGSETEPMADYGNDSAPAAFVPVIDRPVSASNAGSSAQRLTAIKGTTRDELFRRLHLTRTHIDENFTKDLDLESLSEVACLSPHYLLRLFKQVYRQTPHQYVTELRLEYAATLLATSNIPITQVCFEVGYSSLGSFSDLFRRKVGMSPLAYRRLNRTPIEKPSPVIAEVESFE